MGDSIDVVPLGAFYGKGKRHGAYGAFLLAIWNTEEEEFQTVCKAGTGFSDEDLKTHYEFFKSRTLSAPDSNYNVKAGVKPDVWLEACQVWEIKAADLSISPVHTSAFGVKADGKGIGLRFPRFLRIREDKQPEDSTGPEQIWICSRHKHPSALVVAELKMTTTFNWSCNPSGHMRCLQLSGGAGCCGALSKVSYGACPG